MEKGDAFIVATEKSMHKFGMYPIFAAYCLLTILLGATKALTAQPWRLQTCSHQYVSLRDTLSSQQQLQMTKNTRLDLINSRSLMCFIPPHLLGMKNKKDTFRSPRSKIIKNEPVSFNPSTTIEIIFTQAALIPIAIISGAAFQLPSYGLGYTNRDDFVSLFISSFNTSNFTQGILATLPLLIVAIFLDFLEKYSPSLQGVTRASLRSVMTLLGTSKKTLVAIITSLILAIAAGFGEEIMFRGVLQSEIISILHPYSYSLNTIFGVQVDEIAAITISAIVFGALHAVTFLYAAIATVAGIYFGYLQAINDHTITVPIITHVLYDWVALLYAHGVVSDMTREQQMELLDS